MEAINQVSSRFGADGSVRSTLKPARPYILSVSSLDLKYIT
jgi:hypothetical protein